MEIFSIFDCVSFEPILDLIERELLPLLLFGDFSFIDSHCGKFEIDSYLVDTINFRCDFGGLI